MASKHLATKFRQSYSLTSPILRRLSTEPQPPFRSLSEDEGRSDRGIPMINSPVVPKVSDANRSIRTNLCGSESDLAVAKSSSLMSASIESNNISSIIKGATIGPANSSLTSLIGHRISGPKGLGALFTTTRAIHSSAISKEKAANLNVHRPLSPHLPLYQPQMTSTLSIFNRIAGAYLSVLICAFPLLYLKAGSGEETIHGLELKMKEKDLKNKNLQDKVKELESQLLIERKLARQHVDTRLAEQQQLLQQQMKQRQEEQSTAAVRPPLADRQLGLDKNFNEPPNSTLGLDKNFNEPPNSTLSKDQVNLTQPPTENKSYKPNFPPTYGLEKENNPEIAEQALPPRRNGRASICTAAARRCPNPIAPAPRRNSLIPLPSSIQYQPPFLPLPTFQVDMREDTERSEDCLPEQTLADSPERLKSGGKKTSSILRRSLHKKMQLKSPMQQHMRKGGVNVGMERVRVSIGSRGRIAHRVIGNGRRVVGTKETQQKQAQKEKRGWNIGTAGRTVL